MDTTHNDSPSIEIHPTPPNGNGKRKTRPVTICLDESLVKKLRLLVSARDTNLTAFATALFQQAVAGLDGELVAAGVGWGS
jgi:hypothetical protein